MKISKEVGERILKATSSGKTIAILAETLPEGTKISLADIRAIGGPVTDHIFGLIKRDSKELKQGGGHIDYGLRESYRAAAIKQSVNSE